MIVEVFLWEHKVGALSDEASVPGIAFQYSAEWLDRGWNISPLALEWNRKIQWDPKNRIFDGLYGVFADSLPDSWGKMLMDERFRRLGRNPENVSILERLCYVGNRAWGALSYRPEHSESNPELSETLNLLEVERSIHAAIQGNAKDILPSIIESGASTGGARPKQRIAIADDDPQQIWYGKGIPPAGYTAWILKIETDRERQYGRVEKAYYQLAEYAGIQVPETRLLLAEDPETGEEIGHFAIKRFDWTAQERIHCHTLGGLLSKAWHQGDSDYDELFRAANALTGNHPMLEEIARRMIFNIWLGVRDDHAKNHAFIRSESGDWELSPAYDVMYSKTGIGNGLHRQMPVLGHRQEINRELIQKIASSHQIKKNALEQMIEQTKQAASKWKTEATSLHLDSNRISEIQDTWEPLG